MAEIFKDPRKKEYLNASGKGLKSPVPLDTLKKARAYRQSRIRQQLKQHDCAAILLYAQPGANYLQVKEEFVKRMTELQQGFPAGVSWVIPFDTTPFIPAFR